MTQKTSQRKTTYKHIIAAIEHAMKKLWCKKRRNTYLHFIMPLFIVNKKQFKQNLYVA